MKIPFYPRLHLASHKRLYLNATSKIHTHPALSITCRVVLRPELLSWRNFYGH